MGREEEALQDIEVSANTPDAVTTWMDKIEIEHIKTEPLEKVDDTFEKLCAMEQVEGQKETETECYNLISEDSNILRTKKQSSYIKMPCIKLSTEMKNSSKNTKDNAQMSKFIKSESVKEQINRIVQENPAFIMGQMSKNKSTANKLILEPKHWLVCKICERTVNMKAHTRQVHGHVSSMEVVPCNHCCDWFLNHDALKEHMTFHDIERDLRSKIGRTQGPFLYCPLCNYNCYAKKLTRRVKTAKCKTGEKIARGDQVMKKHMETHREMHTCGKCQKAYNSQHRLKEHMSYCLKIFQCDQCSAEFKTKTFLENHILGIHEQSFKSKCKKCDKKFTNDKSLNSHNTNVHTNMERVVCIECGKSFRNGRSLGKHMKSHSHPKAFVCDWDGCGKGFSLKDYLVNHIRIHTKEKPFKCEQCSQTFRKSSHLHRHKKTHTGEKSHFCKNCGKGFIQRINLTVHKCSSTDLSDQAALVQ